MAKTPQQAPKRVLLVNPPVRAEEVYGKAMRGVGSSTPPLGLLYLASFIRDEFGAGITDFALPRGGGDAAARVARLRPHFLGITATTLSIHSAALLAERVKKELPGTKIIVGGPHVTAAPEETFRRFPAFDYGIVGEGEIAFKQLLRVLSARGDAGRAPGVVHRVNGDVRVNPRPEFVPDLDALPPPAWDLLPTPLSAYRPTIVGYDRLPSTSLVTSRGCPGKCTFCSNMTFGNHYRFHSAGYVLDMIRTLRNQHGIRDIVFYDDVFVANRKRLYEICDGITRERLNIRWSCAARINLVTRDILEPMKRAGCWQIGYGVESGSQAILDNLRKNIKVERTREVIEWTKAAGISTRGFFIFGNPGETEETLKETIAFALSSRLDYFQQSFMTPYPGSELYETAASFGDFENNWRKMNNESILFIPSGLTEEKLLRWSRVAFRRFYFRPKILFFQLRMLKSPHHVLKLVRGFFTFVSLLRFRREGREEKDSPRRH